MNIQHLSKQIRLNLSEVCMRYGIASVLNAYMAAAHETHGLIDRLGSAGLMDGAIKTRLEHQIEQLIDNCRPALMLATEMTKTHTEAEILDAMNSLWDAACQLLAEAEQYAFWDGKDTIQDLRAKLAYRSVTKAEIAKMTAEWKADLNNILDNTFLLYHQVRQRTVLKGLPSNPDLNTQDVSVGKLQEQLAESIKTRKVLEDQLRSMQRRLDVSASAAFASTASDKPANEKKPDVEQKPTTAKKPAVKPRASREIPTIEKSLRAKVKK